MMATETEGRAGKADDGKARTREVKLCCVFTQTSVDDEGHPVRDPGSSSYLATFDPASEFGVLMAAEARRRGAEHIRQLTILGDGAVWIWNLADQHFPAATQIVDLYHAREHVHELPPWPPGCCATASPAGSPSAWKNSTTATSPHCWPPAAP
jgi:hypothetical protein